VDGFSHLVLRAQSDYTSARLVIMAGEDELSPYQTFEIGCAIFLVAAEAVDPVPMMMAINVIGTAMLELRPAVSASRESHPWL
jgi:hypothetical protein